VSAIDSVLVTGAFGLVGSAVVKQLHADGRRVVATAHHMVNAAVADLYGVEVRWVDLTKPAQVNALVAGVSPSAIVHLAAVTPPQCYAHRALARAVNVDATAVLVRAAEAQPSPPRFVHASSAAVYGARNPHRFSDVLTADTPIAPSDLYGGHKAEAEKILRSSDLEWSVLRLGGALPVELQQARLDPDSFYHDALLPVDGRLHTVDLRDVASAFSAATTTDAVREVFMIAGDDSHKRLQGEVARAVAAAVGLAGGLPPGRPGNPDNDRDWFPTDWMETTRSQQVLSFQHYTFADLLAETRAKSGFMRYPLRAMAPFARELFRRRSPYYGAPGRYADPWGAIRAKWGEPEPDGSAP
jgi:nucleoside-diphosphate-sugar epimerase